MVYDKEVHDKYYGTMPLEEAQALDAWLERSLLLENADIVLEYKGNEFKNTQFTTALENIDELMKLFIEEGKASLDIDNKIVAAYGKVKSKKEMNNLMSDIDDMIHKFNEDSKERWKDIKDGRQRWKTVVQTAKAFSNKYSEMGMTTRENFDKKFQSYLEAQKKRKDTILELNEKLGNDYDKVKRIDYDFNDRLYRRIFDALKADFEDCKLTTNDLLYLIKILNVEGIKSSLVYNVLNKNKSENLKKEK